MQPGPVGHAADPETLRSGDRSVVVVRNCGKTNGGIDTEIAALKPQVAQGFAKNVSKGHNLGARQFRVLETLLEMAIYPIESPKGKLEP